jgi:hypothetical protein
MGTVIQWGFSRGTKRAPVTISLNRMVVSSADK